MNISSRVLHKEEKLTETELLKIQEDRLFETIETAYLNSQFYRELYDKNNVNIHNISSIEDIQTLPFTYPENLVSDSKRFISSCEIVSIHCSGGTTRNPKTVFRTYADYDHSCDILARIFYTNGIRKYDTVAILQPFGIWAIGSLAFEGLKRIGARALPIGIHMDDEMVIKFLVDFSVTAIFITPSNCIRLAEKIQKKGIKPKDEMRVRIISLAGEKVTTRHRDLISGIWGADVFSVYGSEETDGLATECSYHQGLHFAADHFFLEIINSETCKWVNNNDLGEAVITTLTKNGTPLIRYRIGDIVKKIGGSCECGRTSPLIDIKGRVSEVLILTEGTKVYPYQVDTVLDESGLNIQDYQVIRDKDKTGKDDLTFVLETPNLDISSNSKEDIRNRIIGLSIDFTDAYNAGLVNIKVHFVNLGKIEQTTRGKIIRFIDKAVN